MKDSSTCTAPSKIEIRYVNNHFVKYFIDYYRFCLRKIKLFTWLDKYEAHLLMFFFFFYHFFSSFWYLISTYNYNKLVSFMQDCPLTREFEFRKRSGNFGQSRVRLIPNLPDSTRSRNAVRNTNNFLHHTTPYLSAIITFKSHNVIKNEL